MKHILFPTVSDADAFIADLQSQGVVRPEVGNANLTRRTTVTEAVTGEVVDGGGTAEDAAAGAVKGTGVGAVVGAVAGVLGAGAVVASGGLALPVILGMTALGSGVGAAVGGIGGAAGVDETGDHIVDDHYYDQIQTSVSGGGRAVAVDDNVPNDVLDAAVARHNGQFVSGAGNVAGAAGDVVQAAGSKIDEAADRLRAAGHEVAGAVTGNPKHDVLAAEDRLKAEVNNAEAHADMADADRKV